MMKLFSQLSTDISIHALLAESDRCCPCAIIAPAISIHALLAESDLLPFAMTITALDFYPRSPCGERPKRYLPCCTSRIFLSTLSLRRATPPSRPTTSTPPNFYPRSPCGERRQLLAYGENLTNFYPRSPCGERQRRYRRRCRNTGISIHALLAESDAFYNRFKPCARYFYPRSPCGERLKLPPPPPLLLPISIHALLAESDVRQGMATLSQPIFLSTLSLRRATCGAVWGRCAPQISIHALLAESDCFCLCHLPAPGNFYPRSPCGERQPTRS